LLGMTVGVRPQALNICTGKATSPLDMVEACRRISGRAIEVRHGPARPGDVKCLVGSPVAARYVLGWSAKHSLDNMVASAFAAADVGLAA
jgi:UDP-glucose 4-epimerase